MILKELHPLTGHGRYVFPGARGNDRSMSDAALNAALRRMGYDTNGNHRARFPGDGPHDLARGTAPKTRGHRAPVGAQRFRCLSTAYNRTKFWKERKAMMQLWADYLDKLKVGPRLSRYEMTVPPEG